MVENQYSSKILRVRSNWGGEFRFLNRLCNNLGIHHEISCPYIPQQNGKVERKNCVVEVGLSLMNHAHVPKFF